VTIRATGAQSIRPIPHRKFDWQFSFGFFDFWYCRTNSVRSESFSDSAAGENPYCRFCTFAKLIFATSQTCRIIPQISPFLPSEKAQLVSLAEIAVSLQIKRPIGRHRSVRTVRSIQIFPVGSIQIFEICDKCVQKISWNQKSGENPPLIIAHSPLTNSAHFRIPTFRCGMGLIIQRISADMTFRNPESESDFHFLSPDLVNHCLTAFILYQEITGISLRLISWYSG